jgi:hypothetical protein
MPNVASVTKGIHLMSWPGAALFYFFVSVMWQVRHRPTFLRHEDVSSSISLQQPCKPIRPEDIGIMFLRNVETLNHYTIHKSFHQQSQLKPENSLSYFVFLRYLALWFRPSVSIIIIIIFNKRGAKMTQSI